jgi:hypothetical protein
LFSFLLVGSAGAQDTYSATIANITTGQEDPSKTVFKPETIYYFTLSNGKSLNFTLSENYPDKTAAMIADDANIRSWRIGENLQINKYDGDHCFMSTTVINVDKNPKQIVCFAGLVGESPGF